MQQQTTLLIVVLLVALLVSANGSPFRGDRDGPFRKKPLRRGGCSAFGHSCFGGHGKRSDEMMNVQPQPTYQQRIQPSEFLRQWLQAYHSSAPVME